MRTLTLGGVELHCIEEMPAGLLFDLADAPENGTESVKTFKRILYELVIERDHGKLDHVLYRKSNPVSLDEVTHAVGGLVAEYSGRPTERPSPLPAGAGPIGKPTRVVSFSQATAKKAPRSSKAGSSVAS